MNTKALLEGEFRHSRLDWPNSAHVPSCEIRHNIMESTFLGLLFDLKYSGIRNAHITDGESVVSTSIPLGWSAIVGEVCS